MTQPYNMRLTPEDSRWVNACVEQGIDSRLTGFTKSRFEQGDWFLYCWIDPSEFEILIRRLIELEDEAEYDRESGQETGPEMLADDIVTVFFLEEDQELY